MTIIDGYIAAFPIPKMLRGINTFTLGSHTIINQIGLLVTILFTS